MKKIVISNLKGGVGKTTTAVNLAYSFMQLRKKVLVVDADPQANTTPFFLSKKTEKSIRDVYMQSQNVKKCIYRTKYKDIDIMPGNTDLMEDDVSKADILKNALDIISDRYDICLMDTRPAFEQLTMTCIYAADMVLTPVCLNKFCRDNLSVVQEKISEFGCDQIEWNVFATMVRSNRRAQRKIYEDLIGKHDYPFLNTCVSASSAVDDALIMYKPMLKHRRKNAVANDYMELAYEILNASVGGGCNG